MVSHPARTSARSFYAAFTLIELLTVVAIIGILAAITLGVTRGVNERAAINQTRAELSALATALESYKRVYGDYPQTGRSNFTTTPTTASAYDQGRHLFNAVIGKTGPRLNPFQGKSFIDLAQFTVMSTLPADLPTADGGPVANTLIDPWGRPYIYSYRTTAADGGGWTAPSYILFSAGPDGRINSPTVAGVLNRNHADNLDNVYLD